ncbi:inositol 1,4,5-trisphosphate receptor-interacting protein-like 1 [Pithys albifrons albifrons]|uniref:inositol 1,4,5-trisphosphate receptor-interacting protein-like 1 n=1 Tax=Pithys albifrons albifrons TaxID=3385563 RepID=UPI003A5D01F2
MAARIFLFLLLQSLIQYPQMAGDGLDEDTRVQMEQSWSRAPPERSVSAWGALPWAALQHWHLWALAGVLVLLLGLCFHCRRQSHEVDNNGEEEEDNDDRSEGENNVLIVQEDNRDDGNEVGNVDANEEEAGNDIANAESDNDDGNEVEEDNYDEIDMERILEGYTQWPTEDLERGCQMTTDLIHNFIVVFHSILSDNLYPVPQEAIGVGSTFEGWSPCEEDTVYCVLVPLIPPPGHTFHLELETSRHIPGRNFRIRVEQMCTCTGQQQGENVRCLIHPSENEQRENEEPSFLNTFCTGSYLDVEKIARWFYQLVRASWGALPDSHNWQLVQVPSSRSCKLELIRGRECLSVEILFGVQQGDSDIFVSSQHTEALFTPSTMWPETCSVAEVKFFRHITSQAPRDSWHLKCLQFLARALMGTGFSTYTLKTIVMHLLNTVPVSRWSSRQFLHRLADTMQDLLCSVLEKHLDHFIVGNQHLPEVIRLPLNIQNTDPPNLFHHLARDPVAYNRVVSNYGKLADCIERILLFGR